MYYEAKVQWKIMLHKITLNLSFKVLSVSKATIMNNAFIGQQEVLVKA